MAARSQTSGEYRPKKILYGKIYCCSNRMLFRAVSEKL